jgi:hypothetical protein
MAAITTAAIGVASTVYSSKQASKQAKAQAKQGQEAIDAADPFREYRPAYAEKLDALMKDPSSIKDTPEYKSRVEAAQRQLAAQGYTGSGNAILEVANAGGAAFQQAFQNLSQLSGAGVTPGGGYQSSLSANQAANDNKLSATAGLANNLGNLGTQIGARFNKPATATIGPVTKQPIPVPPMKVT